MFSRKLAALVFLVFLLIVSSAGVNAASNPISGELPDLDAPGASAATTNDLIFIHHSVGYSWLNHSLHNALLAKDYIDERNDIYYETDVPPDPGRPDSLQFDGKVPGDYTYMEHWLQWFNDYLESVKSFGTENGYNRIIMFKSCYPASNIVADGTEPGDPFDYDRTIANYKAVFRHPSGQGHTYTDSGYAYKPLEDIFAENPDVLFIPVTAPPRHYAPSDATTDAEADRAREFNNWLRNEWLPSYNAANPGLNNVAVFDYFDVLAYVHTHLDYPNRLQAIYGGDDGDSHPNDDANAYATQIFATGPGNFIDAAWSAYDIPVVLDEHIFLPLIVQMD
jgi:hypothetical protein